jgi:4-amino-4-deoxy-L-arabinose transferase-like glycosyltransferase
MTSRGKFWLSSLVLLATVLRYHGLFSNTFHADEALFATWAQSVSRWIDPLLQEQIIDKPPLLFYLQAVFYALAGDIGWAGRLPNFIASLLLIPLTGIFAWQLYRNELLALLSAAFVVFSPIAIQFSTTAYTDPLLVFWLYASLYFVSRTSDYGRSHLIQPSSSKKTWIALSGLTFGLAAITKYQAWLFLPLLAGLSIIFNWRRRDWKYWLYGLVPVVILLVAWEVARTGDFAIWKSQVASYGGLRLAWSWELWPRLEAWGQQWSFLIVSPVLGFAILLAIPPFVALLINDRDRKTALDQLFVIFVVFYFILHWFLAVPVWDRYVLPIAPLVGLILTRFIWRLYRFVQPGLPIPAQNKIFRRDILLIVPLILFAIQAPSVFEARNGNLPVGGSPTADNGVEQIAFFFDEAPYGTVLYDHWHSWQWRYHLLDDTVYISWFPGPDALIRDLQVFGGDGSQRYIALPAAAAAEPILDALTRAGFGLRLIQTAESSSESTSINLFQIMAPE